MHLDGLQPLLLPAAALRRCSCRWLSPAALSAARAGGELKLHLVALHPRLRRVHHRASCTSPCCRSLERDLHRSRAPPCRGARRCRRCSRSSACCFTSSRCPSSCSRHLVDRRRASGVAVRARHALRPQDGVLGARLADVGGAAGGPLRLRLARPHRAALDASPASSSCCSPTSGAASCSKSCSAAAEAHAHRTRPAHLPHPAKRRLRHVGGRAAHRPAPGSPSWPRTATAWPPRRSSCAAIRPASSPRIQIGITSIGLLNGIVGEAVFAEPFANWLVAQGFWTPK